MEKEILGACGELAFSTAFNLSPDMKDQSGGADAVLPGGQTVDVKTTSNLFSGLRVSGIAEKFDVYVLVRQISVKRFYIRGWAWGEDVRASPLHAGKPDYHYMPPSRLRNCNCRNFFEAANRLELPAAGDPDPPPPLPEPFGSCKFQPVVQS